MRLSTKKVGGLRFVRIGRLSFSFSISKPDYSRAEARRARRRARQCRYRTDHGSNALLAVFATVAFTFL